MADSLEKTVRTDQPAGGKVLMTPAMREGLDALQREYNAFVESSFQTIAFITDQKTRR